MAFHCWGFSGSSAGKESACNAGDLGSIPGLQRFPREGIGYPFSYSWASLVVQVVKNPPAMQGSPWSHKESDITERLITTADSTKKMFSFSKLHIYLLYLYELIDSNIINGYNFYNHHFAQICLMLVSGNLFKLAPRSFDVLTFLKLLPYSSLSGTERCFRFILFYQPHPALSHFPKEWLLSVKQVI